MERMNANPLEAGRQTAMAVRLRPVNARAMALPREVEDGEMRRAAVTLALALYPLVGSITIVLAALLMASGVNAG